MDADCLIKLTKAGLKERVCAAWDVCIPVLVRRETADRAPSRPDAARIRQNIDGGRLRVLPGGGRGTRGEDEVLHHFDAQQFDAIATDDTRFVRRLRVLGVPYAVPAVVVVELRRAGLLTAPEAEHALDDLRPYISPDEHAAASLMLTEGGGR